MRTMKDSGVRYIGETPAEWRLLRLKNVLTERKERSVDGKGTLLSVSVNHGVIPSSKLSQRTMQPESLVGYKVVHKGDLVFNKLNPAMARFGDSRFDGITSPEFAVYVVDDVCCDARFLQYLLRTERYVSHIKCVCTGVGDGYSRLYTPQLYEFIVSMPGREEVRKITDYLDAKCVEIDKAIAAAEASIAEYEQYKKSVIFQAVTKGLDPDVPMKDSGIRYIGVTPVNWRLLRLKNILTERKERSDSGKETLLSVSVNHGVIPSSELSQRTMQPESLVGYKVVHKGDLVFNKLNPAMARFGNSTYEGITSPEFAVYVVDEAYCDAKYLQYLLRTEKYISHIKCVCTGVGDGYSRLYSSQLYEFVVSIPPRDEVRQLVGYLDEKCADIDHLVASKKSIIEELKSYKKSLIYEVVTGKMEVE